jgi:hypothetical protein
MANMPVDPADESSTATPSPASAGGDLSQGYCIEVSVLPDGTFKVSGPEPLQEEAAEEQGEEPGSEMGQDYDSIGGALKGVLTIVKDNPVGDSGQKAFEAGYAKG